jgi:hypothetical protein
MFVGMLAIGIAISLPERADERVLVLSLFRRPQPGAIRHRLAIRYILIGRKLSASPPRRV